MHWEKPHRAFVNAFVYKTSLPGWGLGRKTEKEKNRKIANAEKVFEITWLRTDFALRKTGLKTRGKWKVQLFLTRLLVPCLFADLPRFLVVGLTVGLPIGGAESTGHWSQCRLLKTVFLEDDDELAKLLHHRNRFPGLFLLGVGFLLDQVIETC